jgi:hypothetical protein
MNDDWEWMQEVLRKVALRGLMFLVGAYIFLLLLLVLTAPAHAETRITGNADALHGRGYYGASVRFEGQRGIGLRLGALKAPDEQPAHEWRSVGYAEVDVELCGDSGFCVGAGVAYFTHTTHMNGTRPNFGLHVRYKLDEHWSVALDHYSHGSALGIAKDKSNRGWNLLGLAYNF